MATSGNSGWNGIDSNMRHLQPLVSHLTDAILRPQEVLKFKKKKNLFTISAKGLIPKILKELIQ